MPKAVVLNYGFVLDINNGITIVFLRSVSITQNPIVITLPISISSFAAFTNPTGVGHAECSAGQTSSTTVRIYCYVTEGSLAGGWYNSILCIGY